jgi:hypothetical protein
MRERAARGSPWLPCHQIDQLVRREMLGLVVPDELTDVLEQAHRPGGRGHAEHGAAHQAHASACGLGRADRAVDPSHIGCETAHGHLALQRGQQVGEGAADVGLRPHLAFNEDVGAVADHGEDALVPEFAQRVDVRRLADHRLGVDLPVARVQDHAQRRANR